MFVRDKFYSSGAAMMALPGKALRYPGLHFQINQVVPNKACARAPYWFHRASQLQKPGSGNFSTTVLHDVEQCKYAQTHDKHGLHLPACKLVVPTSRAGQQVLSMQIVVQTKSGVGDFNVCSSAGLRSPAWPYFIPVTGRSFRQRFRPTPFQRPVSTCALHPASTSCLRKIASDS